MPQLVGQLSKSALLLDLRGRESLILAGGNTRLQFFHRAFNRETSSRKKLPRRVNYQGNDTLSAVGCACDEVALECGCSER